MQLQVIHYFKMYFNRILTQISSHLYKTQAGVEAHQGVMTDRRHSLKRGDRLTKKERQTTDSELGKSDKCHLWYMSKVTATFITIKQATKQLQNE